MINTMVGISTSASVSLSREPSPCILFPDSVSEIQFKPKTPKLVYM